MASRPFYIPDPELARRAQERFPDIVLVTSFTPDALRVEVGVTPGEVPALSSRPSLPGSVYIVRSVRVATVDYALEYIAWASENAETL